MEFGKDMTDEEKEKIKARREAQNLPENIEKQFKKGKLYAFITSKPGQVGKADGYILEGPELEFYLRKIQSKSKGKK